jgi:protein AFG1
VRRAALNRGIAWFSFEELCARPLGAADYMVIAQKISVVFLHCVPTLSLGERNEVRRLITLVDTLYEHKVKLFASAALPVHELFKPGGHSDHASAHSAGAEHVGVEQRLTMGDEGKFGGADEVFAFDRAVSRLIEMGSQEYLKEEWLPNLHKSGGLMQ